jgi:ribose transport system substrate-binding protein
MGINPKERAPAHAYKKSHRTLIRAGLASLVFAAGVAAIAGSVSASASATKGTIDFVAFANSDQNIQSLACGIRTDAAKAGYSFHEYAEAGVDVPTEVQDFQAALLSKPAGIIVAPFLNTSFQTAVSKAMAAGVPVVTTVNTLSPSNEYATVSEGNGTATAGTQLGKALGKTLTSSDAVAVFDQEPGTGDPVTARVDGFIAGVKAAVPGITVLPTQYSAASASTAATEFSSELAANPNLKGVFAPDPDTAAGVLAVLTSVGNTSVKIVGFGPTEQNMAALDAGQTLGIGAEPIGPMGIVSVGKIVAWHRAHPKGGPVKQAKPFATVAPSIVITKQNEDAAKTKPYYLVTSGPPSCKAYKP